MPSNPKGPTKGPREGVLNAYKEVQNARRRQAKTEGPDDYWQKLKKQHNVK